MVPLVFSCGRDGGGGGGITRELDEALFAAAGGLAIGDGGGGNRVKEGGGGGGNFGFFLAGSALAPDPLDEVLLLDVALPFPAGGPGGGGGGGDNEGRFVFLLCFGGISCQDFGDTRALFVEFLQCN